MYRILKRTLDFLIALAALLLLWPILLLLMVFIRIDSPGSSLFSQTRIGLGGKPFTIYKLRTMRKDTPHSVATSELSHAESHITRLGAFLRSTSLDELPQFFNILRGDMSLIGPRPLVPEETWVHEARARLGAYAVRPGVTGWAQVNGRDLLNAGKKAEMDAYYATHLSFALDVRIFFKTIRCVLSAQGIREGKPQDDTPESADATERNNDATPDDY